MVDVSAVDRAYIVGSMLITTVGGVVYRVLTLIVQAKCILPNYLPTSQHHACTLYARRAVHSPAATVRITPAAVISLFYTWRCIVKRKIKTGSIMVILFVVLAYILCTLAPGAYIPNDVFNVLCVSVFVGGVVFG